MPSGITAIAVGYYHGLFLMTNGSLWALGENYDGQFGNGNNNNVVNQPEEILTGGVKAIAAGEYHSLLLMTNGSLWGMGLNNYGELGDGTYNETNSPELLVASNVTAIAASGHHSMFIKSDGSLWAMGANSVGQLGDGTTVTETNRPEMIVPSGVTAISAGDSTSLFIKSAPAGYNQLSLHQNGANMLLSFVGDAETKYALDRSFSLIPAQWIPQATNTTDSSGDITFTNLFITSTNSFWHIRSVP